MPYVPYSDRYDLMTSGLIKTKGDLNYHITQLMIEYVLDKGLSYTNASEAAAAARDAANEMDRRVLSKYEDLMIKKNGDCYHELLKLLKKVK